MKIKIIYLSTYTLYNKEISVYEVGTDGFYQFGMGIFIVQELAKRNYPVECEIWRTDLRISEIMEKRIDGILCKIFPSKKIMLFNRNMGEYSKQFKDNLKAESKKENVVFHIMPNHGFMLSLYSLLINPSKVVWTHLGGANADWKFKNENNYSSYFYYLFERFIVLNRPNHHTITICKSEYNYLLKVKTPAIHMPIFGLAKPEILEIKDRDIVRKSLNINTEKKIILQVGRAVSERGFDWILEILDSDFKDNYYWIFAGIHKEDKFYDELVKRDVYMTDYISRNELVEYYNAADLLIFLVNGKMDLAFGGTGYVPLESLACGTPVVATTFYHFPGNEVSDVSRSPKTKEDVMPMIENLLKANVSREKCREIVLKEFSWDKVIEKYWEIYNSN